MARVPEGFVTAYYANPKTGKAEKHLMTSINFEEATRKRPVNDGSGRITEVLSGEEHLWTMDPPEDMDVLDLTPQPFIMGPESKPPPAIPTRSPDPLRRAPARTKAA